MSRQYTLLATLLLFATQGAASAEDSFLDRSFQMTNAESTAVLQAGQGAAALDQQAHGASS